MQLPYANLQMTHWNPGATMPLVMPVHLVCNTSDEELHRNVRANSASRGDWLKVSAAHHGVAVLCGSGPSLADNLDAVRAHKENGGTAFALNGAASFLNSRGILADYQVMLDARRETAGLIGPAREHLFASQVHPECFARMPTARLWHLQIGGIESMFPEYPESYCLIGGAASVGNTATCLAYAMGYRTLHCYGYDSSHRAGHGHAFHQSMNDSEPTCHVVALGKEYVCTLTMKLQAEKFQETARALEDAGCTIYVHGDGLLPDLWNAPIETLTEAEKYERMWTYDAYRTYAPGEECAAEFLKVVKPDGPVLDFGCGTGRGALKISETGLPVTLLDFAHNCRDEAAKHLPFVKVDLTEPIPLRAPYGYCTDVMEHIPTKDVETVLRNIMAASGTVFFQISTVPDLAGAIIRQRLHLTVRPHAWWRDLFGRLGFAVSHETQRDDASQFVVSKKR